MAKALGKEEAVTTCDCCGKANLQFTIAMELDDGQIVYYGQVCACRNTGKTRPQINGEIKAHAAAQLAAAQAEFRAHPAHIAERARFAERDEFARRTGTRMVGKIAMEFVREATDAADAARAVIAARFNVSPWSL